MANTAFFIAAQTGWVANVKGLPGVAKTYTMKLFAKALGRSMYTLIGALRDPAEIGGYPHAQTITYRDPVSGEERSYPVMMLMPPKWATDCWNGDKWLLFFDEITCVPPAVQAAMLRVMLERVVGDEQLPDDILMAAACNPVGLAANGYDLEPPMANRLIHLKWEFDRSAWNQGMITGGDFPEPKFPILPKDWRTGCAATGASIAAFCQRFPSHISPETLDDGKAVKMDRSNMAEAWPSPRTWHMAADCLAAARSVNADRDDERKLVAGCVGLAGSNAYFEWSDTLDLPDPEALIKWGADKIAGKPSPFPVGSKAPKKGGPTDYVAPARADQLISILGSLTAAVASNKTAARWNAAMVVFEEAFKANKDVTLVCCKPMMSIAPAGLDVSAEFVREVFPSIRKAFGV